LRGHRDDGKLVLAVGKTAIDDGGGDGVDAPEHNGLTLKLTMMETSEHFCNFAQTRLVTSSCSRISAQLAIMPLISVKLL